MNINEFKVKYVDLYQAILEEGKEVGYAEGKSSAIEKEVGKIDVSQKQLVLDAAVAERERIQAVEEQLMPGYEALINKMKFDGVSTASDAAMKVLQAVKKEKVKTQKLYTEDVINAVDASPGSMASQMPEGKEKWTADYEKIKGLQEEFKSLKTYLAYQDGVTAGRVKTLVGRK